jgi:hypothetical protein
VGLDDLIVAISATSAAVGAVGAILWAIRARCYVAVPPNQALVLYGRPTAHRSSEPGVLSHEVEVRHPRIIVGGGVYVAPWNKGVGRLSLDPVSVDLSVRSMHALEGAHASGWEMRLRVEVKVPAEPASLARAAENLLGKTDEEVRALVGRTVETAVPAVLSRVPLEHEEPEWDRLAAEVQASVAPDLMAWGFVIRTLSVTELRRIRPVESTVAHVSAKPVALPDPAAPEAVRASLDSRLARAERNLGIVSAAVARMYQESKTAEDSLSPVSVLDFPLGCEVPGSLVALDSDLSSLHESMEGDRYAPRARPWSLDRGGVEGAREGMPPSD